MITIYRYQGKNLANYFKEKDVTDQGEKWLNWLHSILERFSSDFRKLKICSNICCLNPVWGSFIKSKSHSSLGTTQAWFPTGEPVCGCGSRVPDLAPHWLFWVGAGLHFPHLERFPIMLFQQSQCHYSSDWSRKSEKASKQSSITNLPSHPTFISQKTTLQCKRTPPIGKHFWWTWVMNLTIYWIIDASC